MKQNSLLQLLRRELWQTDEDYDLQWPQVKSVLVVAEEQSVLGLVLHALLNSSILKEHETDYYGSCFLQATESSGRIRQLFLCFGIAGRRDIFFTAGALRGS